jgi:AraC-like DNA-binding protein
VAARGNTRNELVSHARTMVGAYATRRLPVAEMARRLGCSVYHLSRTFKRLEGQTIRAYRAQLRLRLAVARLRADPTIDLTRLALECGFCSHSHFTAAFRKWTGMPPSAFAALLITGRERTPDSADPCGRCSG